MGEKVKKIIYKALPYLGVLCVVGYIGCIALCIWSLFME